MDPETGQVGIKKKLRRKRQKLVLVNLLQDFAKNTSLHGLRYIAERGLSFIEKLFWIITFLISISLCIFLIRNVWVKWQTSPVLVALSEHLVPVWKVPFPSVTICPEMKARSSVYNFTYEAEKLKKGLEEKLNFTVDEMNNIQKFEDVGLICWFQRLFSYPVRNHSDAKLIENIYEVSPDMSEIFRDCVWRLKNIDCEKLFAPVLTTEGLCFTMNSLTSSEIFREENIQKAYSYLNASTPAKGWTNVDGFSGDDSDVYPRRGRGNGVNPDLRIILAERIIDQDGLCNGLRRGFKVYLHHPEDMPQSSLYYYAALPKYTTSFALKLSILNTSSTLRSYHPETRQCYFPEERPLRYFRTYTANNCRLECLSNYTFNICGCVWFHMPHNDSSTICREGKTKCVEEAVEQYAFEERNTNTNVTKCQCLMSCVAIQYDAEILKTTFEANTYIHAVDYLFDPFHNENSYYANKYEHSQIDMYYKEPQFISMRRSELFGLTDFLANCGGLLGLFLGFSFLSLVEIAYFLTLRLGCALRRNRQQAETNEKKLTHFE